MWLCLSWAFTAIAVEVAFTATAAAAAAYGNRLILSRLIYVITFLERGVIESLP